MDSLDEVERGIVIMWVNNKVSPRTIKYHPKQ